MQTTILTLATISKGQAMISLARYAGEREGVVVTLSSLGEAAEDRTAVAGLGHLLGRVDGRGRWVHEGQQHVTARVDLDRWQELHEELSGPVVLV
jgi:hypothetical protein